MTDYYAADVERGIVADQRAREAAATGGPEVLSVKRAGGIAGQVELVALVQYEGEGVEAIRFVGSPSLGGPVVMVYERQPDLMHEGGRVETFVSQDVMDRINLPFGEAWVRKFYE